METILNRKSKDSVFVKFFSDKENILQMYKEMYPDDKDVSIQDINIQTIESIVVNTQYNDLGFTVKDKYIILVEAQSRWSWNVLVRFLLYLTETLKRYIKNTKQSLHQTAKLKLPVPELYVIYSGKDDKPSVISLNDEFFGGRSSIDVRVKVISRTDETLAGQYVGFCKVFDEQRKKYPDDPVKAAKETYRICIEKGYLAVFMKSHETEVISIMEELFNEELAREQYYIAERNKNLAEGEARVIEKMRKSGMSEEQIAKIINCN